MGYRHLEPLGADHELDAFDCGEPALDEPSPTDPVHLILLIKDLRRFIERTGDRRE